MKEKLIQLIEKLNSYEYFKNSKVELTINYKDIIRYGEKISLYNDDSLKYIIDKINNIKKEIKGYNFTIKLESNIDRSTEYGYGALWKSVSFTFYSGNDPESPKIYTNKYGMFEYDSLGDRESFRISDKLFQRCHDKDGRYYERFSNYFEYDNLDDTINNLIELDILLDESAKKRNDIINKLKNYIDEKL